MYKSEFTSLFLDNYLHMQPRLLPNGTLSGMSLNMKGLLATRYCPSASLLSFKYEQFIDDMKRKEAESKGGVRIYMTKADVDVDESVYDEEPSLTKPV